MRNKYLFRSDFDSIEDLLIRTMCPNAELVPEAPMPPTPVETTRPVLPFSRADIVGIFEALREDHDEPTH